MPTYPFLSLKNISIDETLARNLPRHLAYYHRALPIAQDGDAVTVVMAFPNNRAVIRLLSTVLNAAIVPVRGDEHEIQEALERIYPPSQVSDGLHVLAYGAESLAASTATLLNAEMTALEHTRTPLDAAITLANDGQYDVAVLQMPNAPQVADLLRRLLIPMLLGWGGADHPFELGRLLCVVRGHAPDEIMLDWSIRLARASGASITLLAVAASEEGRGRSLAGLLDTQNRAGAHIEACAERLHQAGVQGVIKLRHGDTITQIAAEYANGHYDLIAVAAEAFGDFVQHMTSALAPLPKDQQGGILIVRPLSTNP